ncbi:TetR/AcrR family transcriptional regulator [Deinococcus koreensis]|uniref:TetR family transcriptional regulator n=1 Tax=Deinococcus koreensis TaxID=2054903 RepID=A0A2K3UY78_9DEIO|nr:TetR/AcrR family transcriptional regulator [Deinococcus koreensis]PNY81493.1 TetR family transcriptional regulator [Deinococcus koreensis]
MPQPPKISAETVIQHALTLLERSGEAALSLRALAAGLGVTPNALYWHYADREALLGALAAHGADELRRALRAAFPEGAQELADLTPLAHRYLHFARSRPHLYALLTAPQRDPAVSAGLWADVTTMLAPFVGADRAPEVGVALWAYLHGAAGLEGMGAFHQGKPQTGLEAGLRALLGGFSEPRP